LDTENCWKPVFLLIIISFLKERREKLTSCRTFRYPKSKRWLKWLQIDFFTVFIILILCGNFLKLCANCRKLFINLRCKKWKFQILGQILGFLISICIITY
jgi:hypothetical protein